MFEKEGDRVEEVSNQYEWMYVQEGEDGKEKGRRQGVKRHLIERDTP